MKLATKDEIEIMLREGEDDKAELMQTNK